MPVDDVDSLSSCFIRLESDEYVLKSWLILFGRLITSATLVCSQTFWPHFGHVSSDESFPPIFIKTHVKNPIILYI